MARDFFNLDTGFWWSLTNMARDDIRDPEVHYGVSVDALYAASPMLPLLS